MKIAVLNGSPKGQTSVTMQYAHFLEQKFPETEFKYFDVALKIKRLEKDDNQATGYPQIPVYEGQINLAPDVSRVQDFCLRPEIH